MDRRERRLARRRARRRRAAGIAAALAVSAALAVGILTVASSPSSSSTTTLPGSPATTTTTATTAGLEHASLPPTPGWGVIARTPRGVAVDQRWFTVPGGARVYVMRFRRGATAFHFHVGSEDPPGADTTVPVDTRSAISRAEWRVGVLGAFNGGFKMSARAGGLSTDGYVSGGLSPGMPTVAIDTSGQLTIGTWGGDLPAKGHPLISARQNLSYLVQNAKLSPYVNEIAPWGITLHGESAVARSAVAVNRGGDVLYAVGKPLLPVDLARGLVAAGALRAMELDINPYWPISGAAPAVLHAPGEFKVNNPYSQHLASVYNTGWLRDYWVVMAEPPHWKCAVASPAPVAHKVTAEAPAVRC